MIDLFISDDIARKRLYSPRRRLHPVRVLWNEFIGIWEGNPTVAGEGLGDLIAHWLRLYKHSRTKDRLPAGFPLDLFDTVDKLLNKRGGLFDKTTEAPNFWAVKGRTFETPLTWTVGIQHVDGVDPDKLQSFTVAIENRLFEIGYNVDIRTLNKPLRIEISKPQPPVVRLADYWAEIQAMPQNKRLCAPVVAVESGGLTLRRVALVNDAFSALIVGSPGSGKTQLALAKLLTLCMTNSPQHLSLIVCDVKVMDTLPLSRLPHLATPIVTEPAQVLTVVNALVAEMESRRQRAKAGDRSFMDQAICLYIDELADCLSALPKPQQTELVHGIQRLSQAGRGVALVVIVATQRVYDIPAEAYSQLNQKFVGKTRNAGDGAAAAGEADAMTHKLPGKGAFAIFPGGERVQALFVADADRADYDQQIAPYIDDVCNRWTGCSAFWTVQIDGENVADEDEPTALEALAVRFGGEFVGKLMEIYADEPAKLTGYAVGKWYKQMTGKTLNLATKNEILAVIATG